MKKIHIENIILVILIISSIFLTGSLWFDNYHGLSLVIAKLPIWLNETFDFNKIEYTEYIKPYKITITNGESGNFSYYAFSEGNNKGFEVVKYIINHVPVNASIETGFINEWNELQNRKSVICELGNGIDINMIKSIMPGNIYLSEIKNISDIAVTKSVNGVIIYLKERNGKIYRILVDKNIPEFTNYIEEYSNKMTYTKLIKLEEMGTTVFFGNKEISKESRVLFPVSTKQSNRRFVSEIEKQPFSETHDADSMEKIINEVFLTYEYTKFTTTDNNYIFIKDDGSTIKISNDGIIEYEAKENAEHVENTIISAFATALECINDINSTENLYLLSAIENNETYEFEFGINIASLPVINTLDKVSSDSRVNIYIKVKNGKVIYYKGILDKYEEKTTNSYISSFGHNILDDVLKNIEKDTVVDIEKLELVYDVSNDKTLPSWFTTYKTDNNVEYILTQAAKKRRY